MFLILVTTTMVFLMPSNGIPSATDQQAPSFPQPLPSNEKAPERDDDLLPLYEPTAVNIVDLLQHPPTTMAAPHMEPLDLNHDHRKVYKIRGDYDIRMKNIEKPGKDRNPFRGRKRQLPEGDVRTSWKNGISSQDETDSLHHSHRDPGMERPETLNENRRTETRRRGSTRPPSELERRQPRPKTPRPELGSEPDFEPPPRRRSRRPVWQPDGRYTPRNFHRDTRAPRRHGRTRPTSETPQPDSARPSVSTEYKHGVKIVSEPGLTRKPVSLPKPEPRSLLPRAKSKKAGAKSEQENKDDPISVRLQEALVLEPLQPYDRVVDEDTTEAVDVSRLVQQSSFESKLRELEKQQDEAHVTTSIEDEQDPNAIPRYVEGYSNEAREEEDNLSLSTRKSPVTSLPRQRNATSQGDMMVDVEDLGFEVATSKNASLSQGRLLVPIVDDSFGEDEDVNITANGTLSSPRGIVEDTFGEEMANLTLTDSRRKRKKYSIASRLTHANEPLIVERRIATNSTKTRLRARSTAAASGAGKNVSGGTNNSDSLITFPKGSSRQRGSSNAKGVNDALNATENNFTVVRRAEVGAKYLNRTKGARGRNTTQERKTTTTLFSLSTKRGKKRSTMLGTRRSTTKHVVMPRNETALSGSKNNSYPSIIQEGWNTCNCTTALPKNHPPLYSQVDAGELFSKWKYFEDNVTTLLPNATTTPQELNKTIVAVRRFIIESKVPHHSIDSDYFRKAGLLTGPFPPSKKGVSVNFLLYMPGTSTAAIAIQNDTKSIQSVPLNPSSKLRVIVHDFGQGASERWVKQLKDALLNEDKSNSVLLVGWRRAASRNYWTAAAHVRPVGRKLACLLHRLRGERGLRLSSVHLIGLGLGAHVAGHAATSVIHMLCEKVGRVTGLDVSAPLFEEFGDTLNAAVADYVDLIHTSADFVGGLRGQVAATGHVDYYPGGLLYPSGHCPEAKADVRRDCSRALSAELFVRSVRNECAYQSTSCAPWSSRNDCSGCGPRGCGRMGYRSPCANGTGAQFLHTQTREPYCEVKPILSV